jgi:hypothetical protein
MYVYKVLLFVAWTAVLLFESPCTISGITRTYHHTQLLVEMRSHEIFFLGWSQIAIFPILSSQVARITGMSNWFLAHKAFLFFIVVLCGGTLWHLQCSYNVSTISYLNSHLPPILFISPLLIHGRVTTGIIFAFTCRHTHFLHHIKPPNPMPCQFPLPCHTGTKPPLWAGHVLPSCSTILQKRMDKR